MRSEVMLVTPEIARQWLTHNIVNNRPLNNRQVQRLETAIKNGQWQLTHQGIAFNNRGELIDGQHRLKAIAEAGEAVRILVTRGVDDSHGELYTIDTGYQRTAVQTGYITGKEQWLIKMMPVAKSILARKNAATQQIIPTEMQIAFLEANEKTFKKYFELTSGNVRKIPVVLHSAILAAMLNGERNEDLSLLVDVYVHHNTARAQDKNVKRLLDYRDKMRGSLSRVRSIAQYYEAQGIVRCFIKNIKTAIPKDWYPVDDKLIWPWDTKKDEAET